MSSLDFMVNRFLMKLFNSNDMQTIELRLQFSFNCRVDRLDNVVRNLLVLNL